MGQVQQAMRDARSNGLTRRASSSSEPATPSAAATANGSGGGGAPLLAEGAETALLYVRFRAAAEPGLKGAHRSGGDHIILVFMSGFGFRLGFGFALGKARRCWACHIFT